jgi:putative transposase
MPRTGRIITAGACHHVSNRTGGQLQVFADASDCWKFLDLMKMASERAPLDILAVCLMPNHFHLVLRPHRGEDIGRWMKVLLTTHVRQWHARQHTNGPVWQGRFRAFPIAHDEHLLEVLRYVEGNALRARLVDRAERWPWGSLNWRHQSVLPVQLTPPPVALPSHWVNYVNEVPGAQELAGIRSCLNKQRPYGKVDGVPDRGLAPHNAASQQI